MSDQPQKYQNIREFLDNLPVVPCAWQPDNPNICNTCLRINDSVARVCSVWSQAHEDAPLEEMEFDEEISLMPSIEAIEKDFEKEIEVATVEPVVAEVAAVEPVVAEVAAVEPVVAEEATEVVAEVAAVEPVVAEEATEVVEKEVPEAVEGETPEVAEEATEVTEKEVPEAVEGETPEVAEKEVSVADYSETVIEEEVSEDVEEEAPEKSMKKRPFWKFWGKKEEVDQTEEKEIEENNEVVVKTEPDVSESGFEIGEEVTHKVYGKGPIKSLYLSRDKWFADVEFYKGVKSILVSFLRRPGEEEPEIEEEVPSQPVEIKEEDVKETPVVSTERSAPPIITPKIESQSGNETPETAHAIPVEDIDDVEQEKDPEILVLEKVETERFSDDEED